MYPSECGRALKYIICEGKNGCSIIPKKGAESQLQFQGPTQIFNQPYYQRLH